MYQVMDLLFGPADTLIEVEIDRPSLVCPFLSVCVCVCVCVHAHVRACVSMCEHV